MSNPTIPPIPQLEHFTYGITKKLADFENEKMELTLTVSPDSLCIGEEAIDYMIKTTRKLVATNTTQYLKNKRNNNGN